MQTIFFNAQQTTCERNGKNHNIKVRSSPLENSIPVEGVLVLQQCLGGRFVSN